MLTVSGVHERELVGLAVLRAEAHIPVTDFEALLYLRHDDLLNSHNINAASPLTLSSRRPSEKESCWTQGGLGGGAAGRPVRLARA